MTEAQAGKSDNVIATWSAAQEQPGGLRGRARMTIQTRQAQRVMRGRTRREGEGKPEIIGLARFATLMRWAWRAAERDDPWADWLLLRAYHAINENRETLAVLRQQAEARLQVMPNVQIDVAESLEPIEIPLDFSTPYGYMGAYLVGEYDNYARALLTARHVGLITKASAERDLHKGGHLVRSVFHIPAAWRFRGLTRASVRSKTEKAAEVAATQGWPPQDVLDGTVRSPVAPDLIPPMVSEEDV